MSLRDGRDTAAAPTQSRDATLVERVGQLEHDVERSRQLFNALVDRVASVEHVLEHRLGIKAEPLPKALDKEG